MGVSHDPNAREGGKRGDLGEDSGFIMSHLFVEDELVNAAFTPIFVTFILPTLIPFG